MTTTNTVHSDKYSNLTMVRRTRCLSAATVLFSVHITPTSCLAMNSRTLTRSTQTLIVSTPQSRRMSRIQRLQNEDRTSKIIRNGLFGDPPIQSWNEDLFGEPECSNFSGFFSDDKSLTAKVLEQNTSKLQAATGSEVVDIELHLQMEAAERRGGSSPSESASAFIDSHVEDATPAEKLAMKMIPMQLPGPATKLSKRRVEKDGKIANTIQLTKTQKIKPIRTSPSRQKSNRLTDEEEFELATIIRQGARVNSIKARFESQHHREITRAEWTELAELDSPSTLRRLISSYRKAKNKLVTANMGLVYAVVRQHPKSKKKDVSEDELVQEGSLGLIRAAELFDPEKGVRFSTYATIWIKGVLSNSKLDQLIIIPVREKTKWNKIQKARVEYNSEHGSEGEADLSEIAKRVKMTSADVKELRDRMSKSKQILSLDHKYASHSRSGDDSNEIAGIYSDRALLSDDSLSEVLQMKADVVAALARNLDPREARLMRLRYGLKDGKMRTMVECAEAMGLSRQRVQQLAKGCLDKLRQAEGVDSLQEYLLTVA